MSKSQRTSVPVEEEDESVLFDDGFAIVDDINAGTESTEALEPKEDKSNDEIVEKKETGSKAKKQTTPSNTKKPLTAAAKKQGREVDIPKESNVGKAKKEEMVKGGTNQSQNKEMTDAKKETTDAKSNITGKTTNGDNLAGEAPASKAAKTGATESKIGDGSNSKTVSLPRRRNPETSFVWVSNIAKAIKASGLKKHFSECGKVNTAKVVTNGKVFFGYVEFECADHATKCVNTMNNSLLCGKNIVVSRTRPDVTKRAPTSVKRPPPKNITPTPIDEGANKETSEKITKEAEKPEQIEEKPKNTIKKKIDNKKKPDIKKIEMSEKEKKDVPDDKQKNDEKKPRSVQGDTSKIKTDDDLRKKLNDNKKRISTINEELETARIETRRANVEISNLRRRLTNEQKRVKAEEMRGEKYRLEARSLNEQLKQSRLDYDKEISRLTKKTKLEMEKIEYHRENLQKQKDDLKRREDDLHREFKKLEETKKAMMERMKRPRKSRSISPPPKRIRGRDVIFSDHHSPPPPPKLSSDVRGKGLSDRSIPYYEEKKPRAVYDRLGDYMDKSYPKDTNGRHRSAYPGDVVGVPKSTWSQSPSESWKKPNTPATFLKPYMERYGLPPQPTYQAPSTSYYSPSSADYGKHGHFDGGRKY